jgi:TfoX/Sxy family transcriptional regulator of competence genes
MKSALLEVEGRRMNAEYDLASAVREALAGVGAVTEVKMFGGIGFMLSGNMVAAASKRGLLLRVGSERSADMLAKAGVRPMVMRGRTMEDYVYIDPPALSDASVRAGVKVALGFVQTLPPKAAKPKRAPAKAKRK